jgi:hypothetical protein
MTDFADELSSVLNKHGWDGSCNTPDFILADMVEGFLRNHAQTMVKTMSWQHWPSLEQALTSTSRDNDSSADESDNSEQDFS